MKPTADMKAWARWRREEARKARDERVAAMNRAPLRRGDGDRKKEARA